MLAFVAQSNMAFKKAIFLGLIFFGTFFSFSTKAALLNFELNKKEGKKGEIFFATLKIDTEGEKINAGQVEILFEKKELEVVEVLKKDSVFSLWPKEPSFSNQEGKISFVGGVPRGFEGKGNLIVILFKVISETKNSKKIKIEISKDSLLLLNDGLGTPAFLKKNSAEFFVLPKENFVEKENLEKILEKDNTPPEPFEIILAKTPLIFENQYFICFFAIDFQTGIDHYEISEDGGKTWIKTNFNFYLLKNQSLDSQILVKAVDKGQQERISILKI